MNENSKEFISESGGVENLGFHSVEALELTDSAPIAEYGTLNMPDLDELIFNNDPSRVLDSSNSVKLDLESESQANVPGNSVKPIEVNEDDEPNLLAKYIVKIRSEVAKYSEKHRAALKILFTVFCAVLYNAYLIAAINYNVTNNIPIAWCDGLGLLIVLTGVVYCSIFYNFVLKRFLGRRIQKCLFVPLSKFWKSLCSIWYVQLILGGVAISGLLGFLIIDTTSQPRRLISATGVIILVFIGLLISKYPGKVKWRQVVWSIGLQFVFGLIILRWEAGRAALDCVSSKIKTFLEYTHFGSDFVYGYLSSGKVTENVDFPPIFVFRALSVIFFFGFMISLLYHYGAMQWFIVKLGWILQISIGTTAAESFAAAANIFVGLTEVPLLVKPFLGEMTKSELHAVVVGGFATIAGTVMAAYISFGISASYLLSACVMAAPAALGYSKLVYPETNVSQTSSKDIKLIQVRSEGSALDAAAHGAVQGATLVACIVANVIAFIAFVAFLNGVIGWSGHLVGIQDLSFEMILGKVFIPVAWIIGIDPEECEDVALLLGLKTVSNEFIAYQRLAKMNLSPRSTAIATYALCSFANIGSIGIQLGTLGSLAPERRADLANIIGRAFIAGTLVGFLNACIAGTILPELGFTEWRGMNSNFTQLIPIHT